MSTQPTPEGLLGAISAGVEHTRDGLRDMRREVEEIRSQLHGTAQWPGLASRVRVLETQVEGLQDAADRIRKDIDEWEAQREREREQRAIERQQDSDRDEQAQRAKQAERRQRVWALLLVLVTGALAALARWLWH